MMKLTLSLVHNPLAGGSFLPWTARVILTVANQASVNEHDRRFNGLTRSEAFQQAMSFVCGELGEVEP